ncbi:MULTISPECIES: lipid II-degrading bacteriocin [Cupriavidus]
MSIDIGTLPTVTVYANPPQGDPFWGTGSSGTSPVMPPPGSPPTNPAQLAYGLMYNGVKVFDQAQLGNPQGVLEEFCKGLSGRPGPFAWGQIRSWGEFTDHMAAHSLDIVGGSQYGLTLEQAMRPNFVAELAGLYQWQANGRLTSADPGRSWYGNPLLPIKALWHWIDGGGQSVRVPVEGLQLSLALDRIHGDFKALVQLNRTPGQYAINVPFSYNTFEPMLQNGWVGGTLGRVSGRIDGIVTVTENGHYSFRGRYTLNPDRYDADPNVRKFYQEALTTFLRWIGDTFGHTDYTIEFTGAAPLEFDGPLSNQSMPPIKYPTPKDPPLGPGKK